MDIKSLKLIYFSPTGTTRKILENFAVGMKISKIEKIDLTPPVTKTVDCKKNKVELAIIGAPVYGGRIPLESINRFQTLRANDVPAVIVVVYGNRAFEDALLELKNLAEGQGFKPIAGAAFIGEHSLSTNEMPIAAGRPDKADVNQAQAFGKQIIDLLAGVNSINDLVPLKIPGNIPHKERRAPLKIAPFIDENLCTLCEICIPLCPSGAITLDDALHINGDICTRCCACVKNCPSQALYFNHPETKQTAERLYKTCSTRKEPEIFISPKK